MRSDLNPFEKNDVQHVQVLQNDSFSPTKSDQFESGDNHAPNIDILNDASMADDCSDDRPITSDPADPAIPSHNDSQARLDSCSHRNTATRKSMFDTLEEVYCVDCKKSWGEVPDGWMR